MACSFESILTQIHTSVKISFQLGDNCPSEKAIRINAEQLAEYAIQSQVKSLNLKIQVPCK